MGRGDRHSSARARRPYCGSLRGRITPDGNRVVTSSADGSARVWDLREPIESQTISGHTSFVYGLAYAPDGKTLFTGSADGTGMLSDPVTLASRLLPYTGSRVDRAAFSPDGRYLLLGHENKPPELWDPTTMTLVRPLDGGAGGETAEFSADGAYAVAAAATAPGAIPTRLRSASGMSRRGRSSEPSRAAA